MYLLLCVSQIFITESMMCAVNSQLGNEYRNEISVIQLLIKENLVIGAGPSGMESARLLAMKGHHVEVWKKDKDITEL